jgi:hypothetical protein
VDVLAKATILEESLIVATKLATSGVVGGNAKDLVALRVKKIPASKT